MNNLVENYIKTLKEDLEKIKQEIERLSVFQIKVMGKIEILEQLKLDFSKENQVIELPTPDKRKNKKE